MVSRDMQIFCCLGTAELLSVVGCKERRGLGRQSRKAEAGGSGGCCMQVKEVDRQQVAIVQQDFR